MPLPPWHPESFAARLPFLRRRALVTQATRAFFAGRGYTEVETAYAVPTPGEEIHLRAWRTRGHLPDGEGRELYLHTSPEFAMKRLLVAGAGPIFQLARVWRDYEGSRTHLGEFTMLEWYRPGASLGALMDETEALLRATLPPPVWQAGFERITVADAFQRWAGADLLASDGDAAALARAAGSELREGESWEDLFFRLLLERIEPNLGRERPSFLTHWPASQAALARRDPADPRVALRFELFAGGMELANAFEELTDAAEQEARFRAERPRRDALYGPSWPMDEDFLAALRHGMPQAAGIALGFDRLAMLASGASRIEQVLWMRPP
jgi:lysyl-tRNA synthetase class 2